jgi:hypothetical protein
MIQNEWIKKLDLSEPARLEMECLPEISDMEIRGLPFNPEKWSALAEESITELADAEAVLDELFDVTVTYTADLAGMVAVTRDKNYGSAEELRDLINEWAYENMGIDVIMTNAQFKRALIREGMKVEFAEKLFEKKMVPNPDDPEKNKQVGYPRMSDYLTGSDFVPSRWEKYAERLTDKAYICPDTDSKTLKLMRILNEADDDIIDPSMPTTVGLPRELVDPILKFREFNTKVTRYGYNVLDIVHPLTKRIHTDTTQCAADTDRLTTRPNLQNWPSDQRYRDSVEAPKGWKIVGSDFSQIEPRIIAQESRAAPYMRIFWSDKLGSKGAQYWCPDVKEKLDLYGSIGAAIKVLPMDAERDSVAKLAQYKPGRKKSKISVLGLGYGTGPPKFHITNCLDTGSYVPRHETDALFKDFWDLMWEVKVTLDAWSALADPKKSKRKVYHPFVRKEVTWFESRGKGKCFFHPETTRWWTRGRNGPIQMGGAEILKKSMIEIGKAFRENPEWQAGIILTAHDEIVVLCLEEYAEIVGETMDRVMAKVGRHYCPNVPITAKACIADTWLKD